MDKYEVLVSVEGDKRQFDPGTTVTDKDFPKTVLQHWAEKGVVRLLPSTPESTPAPKKKISKEE